MMAGMQEMSGLYGTSDETVDQLETNLYCLRFSLL